MYYRILYRIMKLSMLDNLADVAKFLNYKELFSQEFILHNNTKFKVIRFNIK